MRTEIPVPSISRPRGAAPATGRTALAVLGSLAALALVVRLLQPQRLAFAQAAFIIFGSILVQALPFVVIGATASAVIEVLVPVGALERALTGLPRPLRLPAAALSGVAMPICECGSVPVARRLVAKGLSPSAAIAFMLAAPVVNPVVTASTFVAFRGREALWTVVGGRLALGVLVAMAVGWAAGAVPAGEILRPSPIGGHEVLELGRPEPRWRRFFLHLGGDFLFMGRYLVLGAALAALVQTFLPASWLSRVAQTPVLGIAAMMVLAALLSLCSESDAFVAAAFAPFGPAAQLAFLVFGPMVDLKLAALYAGTFRRDLARTIVVAAFAVTLVAAMWLQLVVG